MASDKGHIDRQVRFEKLVFVFSPIVPLILWNVLSFILEIINSFIRENDRVRFH